MVCRLDACRLHGTGLFGLKRAHFEVGEDTSSWVREGLLQVVEQFRVFIVQRITLLSGRPA